MYRIFMALKETDHFKRWVVIHKNRTISFDCYSGYHGACIVKACQCECHDKINIPIGYREAARRGYARSYKSYEHANHQELHTKITNLTEEEKSLKQERARIIQDEKRLIMPFENRRKVIGKRIKEIADELAMVAEEGARIPTLLRCRLCGHDKIDHFGYSVGMPSRCRICPGNDTSPCAIWAKKDFERYKRNIDRRIERLKHGYQERGLSPPQIIREDEIVPTLSPSGF